MTSPTPTPSLRQLLSLEDDPKLLAFHCAGTTLPAWALIRIAFIRTIMSELLFKTASLTAAYQQRHYKTAAEYFVRSLASNTIHRNDYPSEICLFSSGLGNYTRGSKTFNRIAGYFANVYPENSFIYQDHGDWYWHRNYQYPRVIYATPFTLYARLIGRIRLNAEHLRLAAAVVHYAAVNAQERLGHVVQPSDLAELKHLLASQLAALPFVMDYYANWFARRNIKLLLKEDASYGARSVPVLAAAKQAGVITAEHQHGVISAGHDGYNVAPALANSREFQQALPEYLLTYGEWWGEQTNLPLRRVAIGNPHFTESTKDISTGKSRRNSILILGDGVETELYLDLAKHVAQAAVGRNMRTIFRPHPLERNRAQNMVFPSGIELDKNSDVYQSFTAASIVISELSTGLFEAAGLVDRVIIWNTEKARFAFPQLPFPSFSHFSNLGDALFGAAQDREDIESTQGAKSRIWADDWQLNYTNFVEGVLSR